jgi:hypothetical protein
MGGRTTQLNRSRDWDGLLRFEYAAQAPKSGTLGPSDRVAELEGVVRDQGARIARLEAAWSTAIDRKPERYARQ